jgi:hypothetical protein
MYTFYEMFVHNSTCSVLAALIIITDYTNVSEGSPGEYTTKRIKRKVTLIEHKMYR